MRSLIITFLGMFFLTVTSFSQTDKFRFEIDGQDFWRIRKNAGGFSFLHQNNLQTSMFFGFNSGINTIDDPMVFGSGDNNTAFGFLTLAANTSGFRNTAIGSGALDESTTAKVNTAVGFGAMGECIDCSENVSMGKSALRKNLSGAFNVAIGNDALNNTNTATRTTALGYTAGVNDSASVDNVYIGFGTGRGTVFATDGYDRKENVMVGSQAGYFNNTNGNIFLGFEAGMNANADNQLYIENSSADSTDALIYGQFDNDLLRVNGELNIDGLYSLPTTAPSSGDFLRYTGGGKITWADIDLTWTYGAGDDVVYEDGDVGIGNGDPIYRLDVQDNVSNGYVARFHNNNTGTTSKGIIVQTGPNVNPNSSVYYALFLDGNGTNIGGIRGNGSGGTMYSTTSDRRLKQNIKAFEQGLATIEKINPATYQMKSNPNQTEIGFIAQELYSVVPTMVGGDPTDNPEESPMTVDYGRLTPVLVAAIKEQQEIINTLKKRLDEQDQQYNELRAEISKLQGLAQK
ncbi:MAG: tail fiber domain-containing protein [Bacteroidota bacterium]